MKIFKVLLAISLVTVALSKAEAYSCSQHGLIPGTLCENKDANSGDSAIKVVVGPETSRVGLIFDWIHPFSLILNGSKHGFGLCKGALATNSMLLGPAACQSGEVQVTVSDIGGNFHDGTITNLKTGAVTQLSCSNTCVDPKDLQN